MAVVSDYNPGDLLTGTAGEGGDDENAVKDLSISDALVKTLLEETTAGERQACGGLCGGWWEGFPGRHA